MVSHNPAKFGGHSDCGSRDKFKVVEDEDSICPCLNPHCCLSLNQKMIYYRVML